MLTVILAWVLFGLAVYLVISIVGAFLGWSDDLWTREHDV